MAILPSLLSEEEKEWLRLMFNWNSSRGSCDRCGNMHYGPILVQKLWYSIGNEEVLCKECIEHRLGRKLRREDLWPCPWNDYRKAYFRTEF